MKDSTLREFIRRSLVQEVIQLPPILTDLGYGVERSYTEEAFIRPLFKVLGQVFLLGGAALDTALNLFTDATAGVVGLILPGLGEQLFDLKDGVSKINRGLIQTIGKEISATGDWKEMMITLMTVGLGVKVVGALDLSPLDETRRIFEQIAPEQESRQLFDFMDDLSNQLVIDAAADAETLISILREPSLSSFLSRAGISYDPAAAEADLEDRRILGGFSGMLGLVRDELRRRLDLSSRDSSYLDPRKARALMSKVEEETSKSVKKQVVEALLQKRPWVDIMTMMSREKELSGSPLHKALYTQYERVTREISG